MAQPAHICCWYIKCIDVIGVFIVKPIVGDYKAAFCNEALQLSPININYNRAVRPCAGASGAKNGQAN